MQISKHKVFKQRNSYPLMSLRRLSSVIFLLTLLSSVSFVSAGNVIFRDGKIISSGNVSTDEKFVGDGSALTNLNGIGGNPFNQNLNTTDNVTFNKVVIQRNPQCTGAVCLNDLILDNLYGSGNSKNQISLRSNGTEQWSFGNDINGNGKREFYIFDSRNSYPIFVINNSGTYNVNNLETNDTLKSKRLEINNIDQTKIEVYHMADAVGSNIINSLEANGTRTQLTINHSLWVRGFGEDAELFLSGSNLAKMWYLFTNQTLGTLSLQSTHSGIFLVPGDTVMSRLNVTGLTGFAPGVMINTSSSTYALNVGGSANITGPLFMTQQINTPQVRGGNGQGAILSLYGTYGTATSAEVRIGYNFSDSTFSVNKTSAYLNNNLISTGVINSTKEICVSGGNCLNKTIQVYIEGLVKNNSIIYYNANHSRWESLNQSPTASQTLHYCPDGGLQWLGTGAACPL